MLTLPSDLQAAIRQALATVKPERWTQAAQALSLRYRDERNPDEPALVRNALEALGYAALLMPATYAQIHGALTAAAARVPSWAPRSMLDLGSGPGTALWAAATHWPTLQTLVAWEREPAFITLGRALAQGSNLAALRAARWERVDLQSVDGGRRSAGHFDRAPGRLYDLVVLGHVLNELDAETQRQVVALAWEWTGGLLLIVEPGTPTAFPLVRAAREQLLAAGAHSIAPCTHDRPCPLQNDWCHFPQRLKRPEFQRRARGAPSEWEDAKFSYAAMARFPPESPAWGRIIREPTSNKAYAEALVSTAEGIQRLRGLKRHREAYRAVKDLAWGAAPAEPPEEPINVVPDSAK